MFRADRIVPVPEPKAHPRLPPTTAAWVLFVFLALGALGAGTMAFGQQSAFGFIVTGLRNPGYGSGAWGLYIAFDVFFVGVSFAGITVAGICRLFDIETLKPITRIAELLTITALLAGGSVVIADLGRPVHGLLKLPRYANPNSPFYGTFTLVVAGYMFSSLVYFFLAGRADAAALAAEPRSPLRWLYRLWASGYQDRPTQRARHRRTSFWLALTILPLLVTAHSTLGFIFGLQSGRPGWFSALQAPGFVVMAGVSGTGMVILAGLGFRRLFRLRDQLPDATFRWLGNFIWILALVYLYFMIVEELTASYAGPMADRELAHAIVTGPFAPIFWTTAGCLFLTFLIPFLQYVRKRPSMFGIGVAALLANVGAVCKRFLIVVPSQTHGAMMPIEPPRMYSPTWVEYAVIAGLFGLLALTMLVFGRFFPLVPSAHGHDDERAGKEGVRRTVAAFVALVAAGLIVVGLMDSFRMWSHGEIDPRIPYSPVIFAAGVMLLFFSAVVYETLPEKKPPPHWKIERPAFGSAPPAWQEWGVRSAPAPVDVIAFGKLVKLALDAENAARTKNDPRAREVLDEIERLAAKLRK